MAWVLTATGDANTKTAECTECGERHENPSYAPLQEMIKKHTCKSAKVKLHRLKSRIKTWLYKYKLLKY